MCKASIGSCPLYNENYLISQDVYSAQLQSSTLSPVEDEVDDCRVDDFILPDTYVAVAARDKDVQDTIWVIKVTETKCVGDGSADDYKINIPMGQEHMKGHFLEQKHITKTSTIFSLSTKVTHFYKETVVFTFVNVKESKKGFEIDNQDWLDIVFYVEQTGYAHL